MRLGSGSGIAGHGDFQARCLALGAKTLQSTSKKKLETDKFVKCKNASSSCIMLVVGHFFFSWHQ